MSEGEVVDVEGEVNQLLEDILGGLILEDKETLETKNLLDTETEPPTKERGGAMKGEGVKAWQWAPLPGAVHSNNE